MKKILILLLTFSGSSFAQWAVHDEELLKEVRKINTLAQFKIVVTRS
jgi:hypothetical protein